MQYSGIIFDFNGVLLWDGELQEQAWRDFSQQLRGVPLSYEEMQMQMHGRPNKMVLEYLLGRSLDQEEAHRLTQEKEAVYRQMCLRQGDAFTLSPGAVELLDFLVAHCIPHTIATASEQTNVAFFIEQLHLENWFDVTQIVLDDGTFPGKPEPDIYLKAAHRLGIPPAQCVVVEDSISGIQAAKRAGIGRIYALGPAMRHHELNALEGISAVIAHLGEIPTTIFALH